MKQTNKMLEVIEENTTLLKSFLRQINIFLEDDMVYEMHYYKNRHFAIWMHQNITPNVEQLVTAMVSFNEQKVVLKTDLRKKSNIQTIGDNPMTQYEVYSIESRQMIKEFQVNEGTLQIKSASIYQKVREDSLGGGDWIIEDFNTINDTKNQQKLKFYSGIAPIEVETETIKVVKDAKITDGLDALLENAKMMMKKGQ